VRVAVIGAGGTGGLYGALLARAGHEVAFLARGSQLEAIRQRGGIRIQSQQFGTFAVKVPATDDPSHLGHADFILFTVKTYDLDVAIRSIAPIVQPGAMLLTVQNGLEAPDQVAAVVGEEVVLIGTTAVETTIAEPGVIAHLSPGHNLTVSELNGPPTPRVENLVKDLRAAEINASVAPDGRAALWRKALFLIPFASITSATSSSIGPIRDLPETAALWDDLMREAVEVARACGYELPDAADWARRMTTVVSPDMRASMSRDFERGGRTELDALTGSIVRLAAERDVPVPTTRAVYALLKFRATQ
jgi:2-dehydropantoate 2-reductase